MATQWVLDKISDAIQPTIYNGVSTAGSYAGGAFNAVGSGINSVGESINGAVRRYGDGVKDYGNGVLDWSNAGSQRAQTASNPLGLSSGTSGGRRAVTTPSIYSAATPSKLAQSPSKVLTTTDKSVSKKPAVTNKKNPVQSKSNAVPVAKNASASLPKTKPVMNSGANRKAVSAVKPATASKVSTNKTTIKPSAKPSSANVSKARSTPLKKPNAIAAANPLGLS